MKYLYLILAFAAMSCSKSKDQPNNGIPLSMNADIVENKWWAISFNAGQSITSTGTAEVEWDVYNDAGAFLYKRSAIVTYEFNNSFSTSKVKTTHQGAISMNARNEKIKSISGTGGYVFSY